MKRSALFGMICLLAAFINASSVHGDDAAATYKLPPAVKARCLDILRAGLKSDEFWPSMHAAEALTIAGFPGEVTEALTPLVATEKDDQRRCGISRELVRAGDRSKAAIMLEVLASKDVYGHTHAAESLFKVGEIGDGVALRKTFAETDDVKRRLMAAAALARSGDQPTLKFIRSQLASENVDSRRLAAWILSRLGDASDLPALRKNADRETAATPKAYAICALAALGEPAALDALADYYNDSGVEIRTFAAEFTGTARATKLGDRLTKLLDDPVLDVRIRAAQSLLSMSLPPMKRR